jgi:hypothetical protein
MLCHWYLFLGLKSLHRKCYVGKRNVTLLVRSNICISGWMAGYLTALYQLKRRFRVEWDIALKDLGWGSSGLFYRPVPALAWSGGGGRENFGQESRCSSYNSNRTPSHTSLKRYCLSQLARQCAALNVPDMVAGWVFAVGKHIRNEQFAWYQQSRSAWFNFDFDVSAALLHWKPWHWNTQISSHNYVLLLQIELFRKSCRQAWGNFFPHILTKKNKTRTAATK